MSALGAVVDADEFAARDAFRASVRRFVEREIAPHVDAWDEAGSFPRELYAKAADAGLIGLGYPEHLGGTPAPMAWRLIATEEVARAGSGGLLASLFSHSIGFRLSSPAAATCCSDASSPTSSRVARSPPSRSASRAQDPTSRGWPAEPAAMAQSG